jgi:putative ABC transport system permease protein
VVKKLEEVPGVKSAAIVDSLPLNGGASTDFEILGRPAPKPGDEPEANIHMVSADYFRTMGIRLVAGRWFTERDTAESPRVMVISETMARQFWPGTNPVGQRVTMKDWGPPLMGTIVGVVGDVKLDGLEAATRPALYWPYTQFNGLFNSVVVRTDAAPKAIVPALKAAIWSINGEQTIASIETMDQILADQFVARRFNLGLLGAFAGLALLLSSLGIYGVLAQAVQQRTQEIGIRMALGAERGDALKLVLSQGLTLSLVGIAIGIAGSFGLMRLMSNLLFGVRVTDPAAFVGAAVLLTTVALAACWIPARRAMRVDPMVALRHE